MDTKNIKDIKLNQFDISRGDKQLLKNTDLTIVHGRKYGLIGPNGMGKTSLLNAINKRELPIPKSIDIFLVEQEVYSSNTSVLETILQSDIELNKLKTRHHNLEKKIDNDENSSKELNEYNELSEKLSKFDIDSKKPLAHKILYGLGFESDQQLLPTKNFSGGWRMRISLAKALFMQPTLLLLDEPTNHLDLNAVIWLNDYLEDWKKTLIIVSHDQEFLDNICTDIIHLHNKKLNNYKGNYTDFQKMAGQIHNKDLKNWELLQKKIREDKKSKGSKKIKEEELKYESKKKNKKNKKNHDQENISSSDKFEKELESLQKPKDYIVKFSFPSTSELSLPILEIKNVSFRYDKDGDFLFKNLDFGINMDDRICIVGTNGVGKSTLMNLIMTELQPTEGEIITNRHLRIGRFNQHFVDKLPTHLSAVEYIIQEFPNEKEGNIRSMLGKYGLSGNTHLIKMNDLSGGQKARVQLLLMSLNNPHIIFMDEPTNHLDMESIEALIQAINNFDGGVVLISHDIRLIENTNCRLWICENQSFFEFDGNLEEYKDNVINNISNQEINLESHKEVSIFDLL